MSEEYRVVWKRAGLDPKRKRYVRRKNAEWFAAFLVADAAQKCRLLNQDPDKYACCSGWECGCGGLTNEERMREPRNSDDTGPPAIEYVRIEQREVGQWRAARKGGEKV